MSQCNISNNDWNILLSEVKDNLLIFSKRTDVTIGIRKIVCNIKRYFITQKSKALSDKCSNLECQTEAYLQEELTF